MKTISDLFTDQDFVTRPEYADLFTEIVKASQEIDRVELNSELADLVDKYQKARGDLVPNQFPVKPGSYSRNYLGRDTSGFESIVCLWDTGAESSIHGHPDFVFYYVLAGQIEMDFFEKNKDGTVAKMGNRILNAGEWVSVVGESGRFDNMIHQVKALEPSLSLHVFSDDALKGEVYEEPS